MSRKILITGATGLIGSNLCKKLSDRGDFISVFTRNPDKAKEKLPFVKEFLNWDYRKPEEWKEHLNDKDAVIHLAGANLDGNRWTKSYKKKIIESREISTRNLVNVIGEAELKPEVFICASGVSYYGNKGEELLTEESAPGDDFLAKVCMTWENEAAKVEQYNVRRVSIRTGAVLSTEEGALKKFLTPFNLYVGGPLGTGYQWFSWIHLKDIINGYLFVLDNKNINGPVNVTSPNPVRMNEFAATLGEVLNRPSFFRVPGPVIELFFGEKAIVVNGSIKAVPKNIEKSGFNLEFGRLEKALKDLLKNKNE
jgi:uncharacterized protein